MKRPSIVKILACIVLVSVVGNVALLVLLGQSQMRESVLENKLMKNLQQSCMEHANMEVAQSNRTDWSVTITLDYAKLTVYALIRYDEQGNGTMITCK